MSVTLRSAGPIDGESAWQVHEMAFRVLFSELDWPPFRDHGHACVWASVHYRIADYNRAIEIDPKNSLAFSLRGDAYTANGEQDRAIADYNRAIEIDPKNPLALSNRDEAYKAKAEHDRAKLGADVLDVTSSPTPHHGRGSELNAVPGAAGLQQEDRKRPVRIA